MCGVEEMMGQRERPPFRHIVYAVVVAVAFLWLLNFGIEVLESHDVLDTTRPDDVVHFVDEALFEVVTGTADLLAWYEARGIPEAEVLPAVMHYPRNGPDPDPSRRYLVTSAYAEKFMIPMVVPEDKGDSWRMLILGASFAMGTPYTHQQDGFERKGGMSSFLREGLAFRYPQDDIEVLNLAVGGQTSHRVARVAETLEDIDPDVVLIATCNNEGPPPPSELNERLHKLAGYRLLSRLLTAEVQRDDRFMHPRQLMDADSIERSFRANLEDIAASTRSLHVPVLLATMPVNYRYTNEHPPYAPCIEPGVELIRAGRYEEALPVLVECQEVTEAARWMGSALFHLGRYEDAERALKMAVDLNPMTQCRPSLNQAIRDVADAHDHMHVVDLESAAAAMSPGGLPGEELFVDFCHMNWKGYGEMAHVVLATLQGKPFEPPGEQHLEPLPSVEVVGEKFKLPALDQTDRR